MNIGTIIQWGSNTIPDNWLLCDGSAVSRTTYADLFAVIGTNFGIGDGSTTFNLPDLRGRVPVGKSSDTEFDTLGKTGGSKELQEHSHLLPGDMGAGSSYTGAFEGNKTLTYNTGVYTSTTGTGNSGNLQPYIVTNYIIKALVEDKVKISELESASSIDGTEVMPIVQSGTTKKITTNDLLSDVYDTIEEVYSTNEVKTNKVWIDGNPVYRKVVTGTTSSGYATNIFSKSNFDTMVSCYGWVGNDTVGYMQLGSYLNANYSGGFYIDTTANYLQIYITPDTLHGKSYYVVMEYTKPTE